MKPTEKIAEDVINSVHGIERAEPGPFLFGKIMHRITAQQFTYPYYSSKTLMRFATAIMLLAGINAVSIIAVRQQKKPIRNEQAEMNNLAKEYFGADNQTMLWY